MHVFTWCTLICSTRPFTSSLGVFKSVLFFCVGGGGQVYLSPTYEDHEDHCRNLAFLAYFPLKHLQHRRSCSLGINAVVYGHFFSCIACQPLHTEKSIMTSLACMSVLSRVRLFLIPWTGGLCP